MCFKWCVLFTALGVFFLTHMLGTGYAQGVNVELTRSIIKKNMKRLGLPLAEMGRGLWNWQEYSDIVAFAESNRDEDAVNIPQKGKEASTAKGMYQFTDESAVTALNRLKRYTGGKDRGWAKEVRDGKKDVSDLNWEQQTALFTANLMESKGSDKFLKGILMEQNPEDMYGLYAKNHHTNPDEATVKNWDTKFKAKFKKDMPVTVEADQKKVMKPAEIVADKKKVIKSPINVDHQEVPPMVQQIREQWRDYDGTKD